MASAEKAGRLSPGHFPSNVGRNPERIDVRTPARFREARVYARALTEAEVAAPRVTPGPTASSCGSTPPTRRQAQARGRRLLLRLRRRLRADHDTLRRELLPERRRVRRSHAASRAGRDEEAAAVRRGDAGRPREGGRLDPNWFDFTTLSEVATGRYEVRADDRVLDRAGAMPVLDVAPHATRRSPCRSPHHARTWRRVLARPQLRRRRPTTLGEGGKELAREQLKLPPRSGRPRPSPRRRRPS